MGYKASLRRGGYSEGNDTGARIKGQGEDEGL